MILIEVPSADPRSRWRVFWWPNGWHPFATKEEAIAFMARREVELRIFAMSVRANGLG